MKDNPELAIVKKVNSMAGSHRKLDYVMDAAARHGHWLFVFYGLALWFVPGKTRAKRRRACTAVFLSLLCGHGISKIIRTFWKRQRPFMADPMIWNFTGHKATPSFPSAHTEDGFIIAFQAMRSGLPFAFLSFIAASVIAFSRLYAGLHYPLDLIGGAGIAAFVHRLMNHGRGKAVVYVLSPVLSFASDAFFFVLRKEVRHGRN